MSIFSPVTEVTKSVSFDLVESYQVIFALNNKSVISIPKSIFFTVQLEKSTLFFGETVLCATIGRIRPIMTRVA